MDCAGRRVSLHQALNAKRRLALTVLVVFLGSLGVAAWQAVSGQGRLHALTADFMHRWRGRKADDAARRQAASDADDAALTAVKISVQIDRNADRHAIAPEIYGLAYAPPAVLRDLRATVNRWGGNDRSRYNWENGDATSAGRDWNWSNKPLGSIFWPRGPSSVADRFVEKNKSAGAATLLTIPALGWVARDSSFAHRARGVPETGAQILSYNPAGNQRLTSVRSVAHRQPGEKNVVAQDEWVRHLTEKFGTATRGGVGFYSIDNEPDLWNHTHTDVHPSPAGYDDVLATFLTYADAVKAVDPTAKVTGPVSWGWTGYHFSAKDKGADNFRTHADQAKHGGVPFLAWFLREVKRHDDRVGHRSLDILDVHFYPQGAGIYGPPGDDDTKRRRLRATRALWDSTYTDESWIGAPMAVLPLLQGWIRDNYPGTQLGITEWNFGGETDISGALAVADTLGIFGREGVALACCWTMPLPESPAYLAFRLFRNCDGLGRGFGDLSCRAVSSDPNRVSVYAATDAKSRQTTVIFVNKLPRATVSVSLTGLANRSSLQTWRLSADNPKQIVAGAASSESLVLPPLSVTLIRTDQKGDQP